MFVWKRSAAAALSRRVGGDLRIQFRIGGHRGGECAWRKPSPSFWTRGTEGSTRGVVGGASKVKESEINLKIVKELETLFADAGFRVVLTRKNDGGLYGLPTNGYKRRDMQKRKEIIEGAQPNAVISVHQNNFLSDRSRRGGQVFFKPNDAAARRSRRAFRPRLNGLSGQELSPLRGDYFMLNCTEYPSCHRRVRLFIERRGRKAAPHRGIPQRGRPRRFPRRTRIFCIAAHLRICARK